jgi:hypothetical protein
MISGYRCRSNWDGAAAAKRMLDAAGFDGDSPDVAKAVKGFLVHDAANPLLRSSYTLPFADIIDGELNAVKGGSMPPRAALTRATDEPVRDEAKCNLLTTTSRRKSSPILATEKSGRRISNANAASLTESIGASRLRNEVHQGRTRQQHA